MPVTERSWECLWLAPGRSLLLRLLVEISCEFQKTYGSCAARLGVFCRSPFDGWSLSGGHLEPQAWGFEWRVPRIHPSVARWPPVPSLELIMMRSCRPFAVFRRTALRCAVALSSTLSSASL